jgi:hypothetical protein
MLRELVTRPISAVLALIELPVTMQRSLRQANDLMEASRRQLEAMQHQTEEALEQAERMNDLLGRVVRLTEPIEMAQRGSEYVGGRLKRAIFGAAEDAERAADDAEEAAQNAEQAASFAATEAEEATSQSAADTRAAAERLEEARRRAANPVAKPEPAAKPEPVARPEPGEDGRWRPAGSRGDRHEGGGLDIADPGTVRVIPNQPPPGDSE